MSKGIVNGISGALLLLLLSFSEGYSQDKGPFPVKLMFYNAENLFDTIDDTATNDNEFLPDGLRRWTFRRYNTKIESLFKTIIAAGEWDTPSVIGLCEIENRDVLEDLVYGTGLSDYNYGIIHEDSPDPRGIDVCLLYRKDLVKILKYNYIIPEDEQGASFLTRSILYAKFSIGSDTLHLFLNHWPSRRGGVLAGEMMRKSISEMLKLKADSVAIGDGRDVSIIFAGDFNAVPADEVISSLTGRYKSGLKMVNLSQNLRTGYGTYRYMGTWEMIDQVIVSDALLNDAKSRSRNMSLRIFKPDFLLQEDPNYPGPGPFSTYRGYRYQGGFSDHLPVLLEFTAKSLF